MLVRHELQPQLAFNDNSGRWIVIQCNVNGDIFDFASVYAPQTSAMRASLWDSLCRYPWRSNAFICGDFNNSPLPRDNTTSRSHMLSLERHKWDDMLLSVQAEDLWILLQGSVPGYTFHHNALTTYWATFMIYSCCFELCQPFPKKVTFSKYDGKLDHFVLLIFLYV